jgi:hypothetical protein
MTNHNQIEVQNEAFLSRLFQEVQAARSASETTGSTPHPEADMLYDYVAGWLDEKDARPVRMHLATCHQCAHEALHLMRLENELEQASFDWAERAETTLLAAQTSSAIGKAETSLAEILTTGKRAIQWLSDLWEPQWAGQLVTATDLPEQIHVLTSEYGDIKLSCDWQDASTDEPATLRIAWQAHLFEEPDIWLRFMNPLDQAVRHEVNLGTRVVGEEHFTSQELGFDFFSERWAVAVALVG